MEFNTALVVDDSKLARVTLGKQLEQRGLNVISVDSGQEAINHLKASNVDVIFMDHLMPEMSGFETMESLKKDPATSNIPIIMCTAKEEPDYHEKALAKGAASTLAKPATDETIDSAIRSALTYIQTAGQAASISKSTAEQAKRKSKVEMSDVVKVINFLKSQVKTLNGAASIHEQKIAKHEQQLKEQNEIVANLQTAANLDEGPLPSELDSLIENKVNELFQSQNSPAAAIQELVTRNEALENTIKQLEEKLSVQETLIQGLKSDGASNDSAIADTDSSDMMAEIEKQLDFKLQSAVDVAISKATTPVDGESLGDIEVLIEEKISGLKPSEAELKEFAQSAINQAIQEQSLSAEEVDYDSLPAGNPVATDSDAQNQLFNKKIEDVNESLEDIEQNIDKLKIPAFAAIGLGVVAIIIAFVF